MTSAHDGWLNLMQPITEDIPRSHSKTQIRIEPIFVDAGPPEARPRTTRLELSSHVGTHVDAAVHFIPGRRTIDEYPIELFRGEGIVLDARREGAVAVTRSEIEALGADIRPGDFVFFHFGYGRRFRQPDYFDHPYLAEDVATWFRDMGVRMVGSDTPTPDMPGQYRPAGYAMPVHMTLLSAEILIIENLSADLAALAGMRVEVFASPLPIVGADGSPLTIFARPIATGGGATRPAS